jgi:hypothetical protein
MSDYHYYYNSKGPDKDSRTIAKAIKSGVYMMYIQMVYFDKLDFTLTKRSVGINAHLLYRFEYCIRYASRSNGIIEIEINEDTYNAILSVNEFYIDYYIHLRDIDYLTNAIFEPTSVIRFDPDHLDSQDIDKVVSNLSQIDISSIYIGVEEVKHARSLINNN